MELNNILVTGANGQLGNELRLLSKHDNKNWFFTDVEELDILDKTAVTNFVSENSIQAIVNCAAYTAVDKAETDLDLAGKINAVGPENLAEAAHANNSLFIHVSTDFVFDGKGFRPYVETDEPNPISAYGKTKLDGEQAVRSANPGSIILRTSWLYSAFGNNFVKTMMRLGHERDALNVIFDQIGSPTWARDLALAIVQIITEKQSGNENCGIYHFSNEGVASWYDFTRAIHEIAGISCNVSPIETKDYPTPAARPHYSVMNKGKVKSHFNLSIPYWKDSLKNCIKEINQ